MDTLTLGAFARSGNHYFQHLVETALISVRCDWLSHRISDWDEKKNPVTIVRHPLDCVSSWISTTRDTRDDRCEKVLEWYLSYHDAVLDRDIFVLQFDELIAEPLGSINKVCDAYNLNRSFFSSNETLAVAMESNDDFIWANPDKSDYAVIRKEIQSSHLYPDAVELFGDLCAHAG